MKLIEACELVFVAEGVLNVVSGTLLTFFPAFVMAQQGLPATDELANGNLAQFGTLVLLLGYMGLRARATPKVIEALLFGDVLWCGIFYLFVRAHHGPLPTWTFGSHFSLFITVFLAASRITYLVASYSASSPAKATSFKQKAMEKHMPKLKDKWEQLTSTKTILQTKDKQQDKKKEDKKDNKKSKDKKIKDSKKDKKDKQQHKEDKKKKN